MIGTHWEQGKRQKKSSLPSPPKEKNWTSHECMLSLIYHWPRETLISKIVCHHFWPGQMPGAQIAGYSIAICISVSKQFLSKQQSDDRLLGGS
jgi:hypothetical protein